MPTFQGQLTLLSKGVRHVLTHRVIIADFYLLNTDKRPATPDGYVWVNEEEATEYACRVSWRNCKRWWSEGSVRSFGEKSVPRFWVK